MMGGISIQRIIVRGKEVSCETDIGDNINDNICRCILIEMKQENTTTTDKSHPSLVNRTT